MSKLVKHPVHTSVSPPTPSVTPAHRCLLQSAKL